MGCCLRKLTNTSIIDILDYTPKDSDFEYLRPCGRIIVHIDEKFKVSVLPLDFDNCIPSQIRLWPSDVPQKNQFLMLERTPPVSPLLSCSSDSGVETVF